MPGDTPAASADAATRGTGLECWGPGSGGARCRGAAISPLLVTWRVPPDAGAAGRGRALAVRGTGDGWGAKSNTRSTTGGGGQELRSEVGPGGGSQPCRQVSAGPGPGVGVCLPAGVRGPRSPPAPGLIGVWGLLLREVPPGCTSCRPHDTWVRARPHGHQRPRARPLPHVWALTALSSTPLSRLPVSGLPPCLGAPPMSPGSPHVSGIPPCLRNPRCVSGLPLCLRAPPCVSGLPPCLQAPHCVLGLRPCLVRRPLGRGRGGAVWAEADCWLALGRAALGRTPLGALRPAPAGVGLL